ncbi:type 1 glutamine amidotransferase [Lignipirellula cremea]|uniref:GMP synthase [glutamine-hydrolyzing] n=1 Tax=Lignipirellula cremea TaxID=2528010 RepID=A0A518DRY7_9BACT|nr:type 1 glutamine amidotransferase [Lignipirellula cremea]QDU94610.1 GMP synthase [glutamine-hydrolyzing] [Lignipirellula cremea]
MHSKLRFLLLQVRNDDDPMIAHEIRCFAKALGCRTDQIATHDLISGPPTDRLLDACDMVVLGGSGDYSVASGGPWLPRALDGVRRLVDQAKPTFASCWGFQALAQALGGQVVTDLSRAELGTIEITLTQAGLSDPIFGAAGSRFLAPAGHQDRVAVLPPQAELLASSAKVDHQAFRLPGKPIYCTQFHPELGRADLLVRVGAYPTYIQKISGMSREEFEAACQETPACEKLLARFLAHFFGE